MNNNLTLLDKIMMYVLFIGVLMAGAAMIIHIHGVELLIAALFLIAIVLITEFAAYWGRKKKTADKTPNMQGLEAKSDEISPEIQHTGAENEEK